MLSSDLKRVALRLLKALDVPEAAQVSELIKQERWDELVKLKFNPIQHQDRSLSEFRRVCLAQEFLRKAEFLDTSIDVAQVARDGFLSNEAQCFRANRHLERFFHHQDNPSSLDQAFMKILSRAQAWLRLTLGPVPSRLNGKFGPGAVFESEVWRHKRSMTAYDKLRNMPCASPNVPHSLIYNAICITAYGHAWGCSGTDTPFPRVRGNRFTTVPKNAATDRGIAIEPGINVLLQLAVGDHLKSRLRRRGIDLRGTEDRDVFPALKRLGLSRGRPWKGQSLHRRLAMLASLTGSHATVDLSNASDTICLALVELLLPEVWYTLLSDLRSPMTRFSPTGKKRDQRWIRLEKFSSMGNGFTFELETLIFCALAHGVGAKIGVDTFVYGDDIIIPDALSRELLAVLQFCGLTPNKAKTFCGSDVLFRESCGGDFLLGHDVRPFYIKEHPHDPTSWISLANNLRSWSLKWDMPELNAVRAAVLDQIPSDVRRCRGPEIFGDLLIHDDEPLWNYKQRGSQRFFRVWRPVTNKRYLHRVSLGKLPVVVDMKGSVVLRKCYSFEETGVALAAALTGLPSDGIAPRDSVEGYRFGRIAYS